MLVLFQPFNQFLRWAEVRRAMKIIKALSLIYILTIAVIAQQNATVSGTLIDEGQIVANQKIRLVTQNETFETATDQNGNYRFENIANGTYLLVYNNKQASVTVENGAVSVANLADVVVISANTTQTIDEVAKSINIIDGQEMRDRADFTLAETLRTIPGFRVQQLGGFGRTATIKTRGLRNQDTALLIDGIRFRDAASITGDASAFLSDFTLTSVSRVEVLRGSGSSLYGTNAIGGTIDFQTPKPQSGFHGQIGGAAGGYGLGRFRGNISDGTTDGKFGFNLGVSRTVYTKGIDGEDDAHNTNFQSRIEYNPFTKTNISTRFFVSDAYVRLNSSPNTAFTSPFPSNANIIEARPGVNFAFDANDPDNFQKSKFFNGQVVLTQIISDDLVFQGFYSGLKTSRKNTNGILGAGFQSASTSIFDGTIQTANGHLNWTPNRANQITFGYEFEHEKYGNDGFTPSGAGNFSTRAFQSSNTFYAQDLLKFFGDRLQIAGGFRAQFFSLKTPEFSLNNAPYSNVKLENPAAAYTFDGAASYFFEKTGTKIRAHVGNGYRVPSLYERFGTFYSSFGTPSFVALGNPNLQPEKTIAFDGGIEQNLFDNRAKLTAVYFYTKLIDTIGYGNAVSNIGTTPRPFGGYLNTKGGIARGAEFSGQVKPTGSTDIFASYTYTNSDQRVPQVSRTSFIETLGIPKQQFTLVATQRFKRAWVNFDFLATSDYLAPIFSSQNFNTYVYRFNGNRRADLTAGYTFPLKGEKMNLRVHGTVENLFDYEYYENGFRTLGRNGRVGVSLGF
ncbi:MAG: Outer rane receptor for ferrienterochelin and colicin [Acidobacteria bacterium]|nr:Outer rane receptor for ferrienterochelin and colicin [Acidobacteriota bacterium]